MQTVDFTQVKKQEAQSRKAALRMAGQGRKQAAALQRRASLVGDAKWRITNLKQVARAMSRWA